MKGHLSDSNIKEMFFCTLYGFQSLKTAQFQNTNQHKPSYLSIVT